MTDCKLLIVGAGAAGISAAVSAWEAGCRSILLTDRREKTGGVLPQCIHEGFGRTTFGRELTGPAYAARLGETLSGTGVCTLLSTEVLSVSRERTAVVSTRGRLEKIRFERMILASGCREKSIGEISVAGTRPAGIFTAGQAQERINLLHQDLGSRVLVLGSGDLGMIIARRFALEGKQVIAVLEQGDRYSGMARNYRRCIEAYRIPLRCRMTVRVIHGENRLSGVTAAHLDSGEREFIPCDTLITALGLVPDRELIRGLIRGLEGEPWLSLAGNCREVHELVDSAAAEAKRVGTAVGLELRSKIN